MSAEVDAFQNGRETREKAKMDRSFRSGYFSDAILLLQEIDVARLDIPEDRTPLASVEFSLL